MKKTVKLLMMLSVMAVVLLGASTIALADSTMTTKVGDSDVTISIDKDGWLADLTVYDGVDVTYTITSADQNIFAIWICGDQTVVNAKSCTVTKNLYSMDSADNILKIQMADGSTKELANCPVVLPAKIPTSMIKLMSNPSGFTFEVTGTAPSIGPEYDVAVYTKASRTKSSWVGTFTGKPGEGSYQVKKSTHKWYKPNTTYYLTFYPSNTYGSYGKLYGYSTNMTVKTAPTTAPVVKSVKISNVKVTSYFDWGLMKTMYKTSYKMTVTLSKKATGTKGIVIAVGGTTKTLKGTGKTFTTTVDEYAYSSKKGKTATFQVKTYSAAASNGYAYSPASKIKKYTIKNGTKTY